MARHKVNELIAEQSLIAGWVSTEIELLMMARALEIAELNGRGEKKMSSLRKPEHGKPRAEIRQRVLFQITPNIFRRFAREMSMPYGFSSGA
jgi:hypothetical protein